MPPQGHEAVHQALSGFRFQFGDIVIGLALRGATADVAGDAVGEGAALTGGFLS